MTTNPSCDAGEVFDRIGRRYSHKVRGDRLGIAAEDSGSRGPTCVLLHGRGENRGIWSMFAKAMSDDYRCLCIDLCGHGDSDWDPDGRYDPAQMAQDVFELLRAERIERPILIGHSLGGTVALHLSMLLTQNIAGLVLVDFTPDSNSPGAANVLGEISSTPNQFASIEAYVEWLSAKRPLANKRALYELAAHALRYTTAGVYEPKFDRLLGSDICEGPSFDRIWALIEKVSSSCLLVRGIGSAVLSPQTAKRIVQALHNGNLVTVGRAGHAVMADNPEGFALVVRKYLQTT